MGFIEVRISKRNPGEVKIEGKAFEGADHSAVMKEMANRLGEIIEQTPDHEHVGEMEREYA